MRTSILCWAGALLLALPGCGDDANNNDDDDDGGGAAEVCDNGQDDDGDGAADCSDSDCAASCPAACGNGAVDMGEECDGADLGGQTCEGLGHPGGTLACSASCTLDPSGCDPIPGTCGNGAIDAGEACDGADLGGQSCESLGFDGGTLACSPSCAMDQSGCTSGAPEICGNGQDDDGNGLADCLDPACAADASCSGESCDAPMALTDGVTVNSNTTGGSSVAEASCTGGQNALELVFAFTAGGNPGEVGVMHVELESATDQGIYVRTDCEDEGTELGCTDDYGGGTNEVLDVQVQGGQTVYIYVDGYFSADEAGPFGITATWAPAGDEDICDDLVDNDFDGLIDCSDPTCQAAPVCQSGMSPTGSPCDANNECAANNNDPVCLTEPLTGWPMGYCSEGCDLASDDCASGALCVDLGWGPGAGLCLDECATHADCRPGYYCDPDLGNVCYPGDIPETCDNGVDDNGDGLVDCDDPTCEGNPVCPEICDDLQDNNGDGYTDCEAMACQATMICTPGTGAVGTPCSASNDCAANNNDPSCLSEPVTGWPMGYCSEFCDLAANDCASGSICVDVQLPSGSGYCLDQCTTSADCRAGYYCDMDLGSVCVAGNAPEVCDNGVDDNGNGLVDCMDPSCDGNPICPEMVCDDFADNDQNDLFDCEDPGCQATMACAPGAGAAGVMCTANTQCAANMNDPICLSEAFTNWPDGYCSQFCDLMNDDCPSGAACLDAGLSPNNGVCFDLCTTSADCRAGYQCLDVSGTSVCFGN